MGNQSSSFFCGVVSGKLQILHLWENRNNL